MYCAMHFYIDSYPLNINNKSLIEFFEYLVNYKGMLFDYIGYELFNLDGNGLLEEKKYPYNLNGIKMFRKEKLRAHYMDKNGNIETPIIYATEECRWNETYKNNFVLCLYPREKEILKIYIYFRYGNDKIIKRDYFDILGRLNSVGYHVNNSFYDIYYTKNGAFQLTGSYANNIVRFFEKREKKYRINHELCGHRNCIFDVFCANSIVVSAINVNQINSIKKILGADHVKFIDDSLVFCVCGIDGFSLPYRLIYNNTIRKLREVLISI